MIFFDIVIGVMKVMTACMHYNYALELNIQWNLR